MDRLEGAGRRLLDSKHRQRLEPIVLEEEHQEHIFNENHNMKR